MSDEEVVEFIDTIWFVPGTERDWMANIYKAKGDPTWRFRYRFRYYSGTKDPFDRSDRKSSWTGTDNGHGLEHLRQSMDSLAWKLALEWGGAPNRFLVDGPPEKLIDIKDKPPWMHLKRIEMQ